MKTVAVRLSRELAAEIEAESQRRRISRSDVVRERLAVVGPRGDAAGGPLDGIADLIGSVDGLPAGLSTATKKYLRRGGYGGKRHR